MLNQANFYSQLKPDKTGLGWFAMVFSVLLMSCFSQPFFSILQSRLSVIHDNTHWVLECETSVLVCCCCVFLTIWFELIQLWSWPVMLMPCVGCKTIDLTLREDRSSWFHVFKHSLSRVFWNGVQWPPRLPKVGARSSAEKYLHIKHLTYRTIYKQNGIVSLQVYLF